MLTNLVHALGVGEPRVYPAGTILYRQGATQADVYLVVSGFVDLVATDPADGLSRSLSWRGPGQLVGDARALLGAAAPVMARTATRCVLHRIPAASFLGALAPDAAPVLWQLVLARSRQLLELTGTMALFAAAHARQRLEHVLARLLLDQHGQATNGNTRLTGYSPTNRELAGYVGVNPTYVPALIGALEQDGVARRHRGFIVINDPSRLVRRLAIARYACADTAVWQRLFDLGTPRRYDAGYGLFQQHDPAEDVYVVASGFIDLSASADSAADAERSLWWAQAGDLLGDGAAILATGEQTSATTKTRCLLHRIPARTFLAALTPERNAPLYEVLQALSGDIRACMTDMAVTRLQPLRTALQHVLCRLVDQHGGWQSRPEVALTDYSPSNATLAGYVGSEERYVSQLLHDLKTDSVAWRDAAHVITVRGQGRLVARPQGVASQGRAS